MAPLWCRFCDPAGFEAMSVYGIGARTTPLCADSAVM